MISLFRPFMGDAEIEAVSEVIRSGWIGLGPKTGEFEKRLAEYIGVPYMVGLNSATSALELAVRLLNIRSGDQVIVPAMTFVSTAHVVIQNLATPVFADVERSTLNIDIDDVASKISPLTRAIIPVHYGGRPVDIDRLREIAGDIPIIEDAAHACGAEYKEHKCGSLGDIGALSFHAVKNLATGDGGALALKDKSMAERARKLRWLGIDKGTWDRSAGDHAYLWDYSVTEIGYKSHMNDIAAAIGLVQLSKLDAMNGRRREIVQSYNDGFKDLSWLQLPPPDTAESKSSWHIYCVQCDQRDELNAYLTERGIGTGVHYRPIHMYKCYGNRPHLPVAEEVFTRILSLPMHPGLSDGDVNLIVDTIRGFGGHIKRRRDFVAAPDLTASAT
jgi:dTDP-4-amino-4,6-dideoxygalactose transaminase